MTFYKANENIKTSRNHLRIKHKIDVIDRNVARNAIYDNKIQIVFARIFEKERLKKKRYAMKYMINNLDKTQLMYLYFR